MLGGAVGSADVDGSRRRMLCSLLTVGAGGGSRLMLGSSLIVGAVGAEVAAFGVLVGGAEVEGGELGIEVFVPWLILGAASVGGAIGAGEMVGGLLGTEDIVGGDVI